LDLPNFHDPDPNKGWWIERWIRDGPTEYTFTRNQRSRIISLVASSHEGGGWWHESQVSERGNQKFLAMQTILKEVWPKQATENKSPSALQDDEESPTNMCTKSERSKEGVSRKKLYSSEELTTSGMKRKTSESIPVSGTSKKLC
jgi:hypothetical protein